MSDISKFWTTSMYKRTVKVVGGSADLKISESALLSLNHHNFSST